MFTVGARFPAGLRGRRHGHAVRVEARGYRQIWETYVRDCCKDAWLRNVKTLHVQGWLEQIARIRRKRNKREYTLSKTTLAHIKNFLSGVFRHAAQQGYFDGVNPVRLSEIPAFAPKGKEGRAYSFEDIDVMLRVLPEPAATIVATAAYTGLRLGELQGLTWADYSPPAEGDDLGVLHVRRSVWRGIVGEPKTDESKSAVPVVPQLVDRLAAFYKSVGHLNCTSMFANGVGKPMDLNALYYRQMRDVIKKTGVAWIGWHGFRRGYLLPQFTLAGVCRRSFAIFDWLQLIPPFVEQSPVHSQFLGESDDVVASLQPLDGHLPESHRVSPYCSLFCHSQFLSLQSVPMASVSFEGFSPISALT